MIYLGRKIIISIIPQKGKRSSIKATKITTRAGVFSFDRKKKLALVVVLGVCTIIVSVVPSIEQNWYYRL